MPPTALDLPGPSRRIRIEPLTLPVPAKEPVAPPVEEPAREEREPVEEPAGT